MENRPPLPPFTEESAVQKVRMAEDGWNSRDPVKVSMAYTEDSRWRNRAEFLQGREAIQAFLTRKWGPRAGLPAHQRTLGLQRQPDRGALSNMSTATIQATGSGHAETNSGSFPTTV